MNSLKATYLLALILSFAPVKSKAYDMDCAIMLCMAGGFPPSSVCANAYRIMIRRITPWPSLPPFGICSYAAVPISLGGPGGTAELNTSLPDYEWLNRTRVLWWSGRTYINRDGVRQWDWALKSCDGENRSCHSISRSSGSFIHWPSTFLTENGQVIVSPAGGVGFRNYSRAVMIEYGDYEGVMDHSEWFRY